MEITATSVRHAMRFRAEQQGLLPYRAREKGLTRIDRGAYLDPSGFVGGATRLKPWEVDKLVAQARLHAVACRVRQKTNGEEAHPAIFTGEPALVAGDLPYWGPLEEITLRAESARGKRSSLPALTLFGRHFAPVPVVHLGELPPATRWAPAAKAGLVVAPGEVVVWDMSRRLHSQRAFANTCVLLANACGFGVVPGHEVRHREGILRNEMLSFLAKTQVARGQERAKALVERATAQVGSVLEAGFLWMLHCWIKEDVHWEPQWEVFLDGARYFCDAAVPSLKIALEFDGAGKMGVDDAVYHSRAEQFLRRQQAFLREKWTMIRVLSSDLKQPENALMRIGEELKPFGICRSSPGGPLWEPFS